MHISSADQPKSDFLTNKNGQWILAVTQKILVVDVIQSHSPHGESGIVEHHVPRCLREKTEHLVICVYG